MNYGFRMKLVLANRALYLECGQILVVALGLFAKQIINGHYLFGSVCPATGQCHGWRKPYANTWIMNLYLKDFAKQLPKNIIQKVIRKDIPMVSNLRFEDIENIEKTLSFIGKSEVDGINFSSISRNLGITKYKAELFVKFLSQAFILNPIYPRGTNVLKEPKVLMLLPFR